MHPSGQNAKARSRKPAEKKKILAKVAVRTGMTDTAALPVVATSMSPSRLTGDAPADVKPIGSVPYAVAFRATEASTRSPSHACARGRRWMERAKNRRIDDTGAGVRSGPPSIGFFLPTFHFQPRRRHRQFG